MKQETPRYMHRRKIFYKKLARTKAIIGTWLACKDKLATKERLKRFGIIENDTCYFCPKSETLNHIMFHCPGLKHIWREVMDWL